MSKKLALLLSAIFHPIFIPTWVLLVLLVNGDMFSNLRVGSVLTWYYVITNFIISSLVPLLLVFFMKKLKVIRTLSMDTRSERLAPILMQAMFLYATYYVFRNSPVISLYSFYILCATLLSAIALLVTAQWKISLHTLGWGAFVACLVMLCSMSQLSYLLYLVLAILITGWVSVARLQLGSHTPAQIYSGFGVGFSFMFIMFLVIYH